MPERIAQRRRLVPGSVRRLRVLLGLLFLGLALPAALLVRQGFVRLELEEFRRQQLIAESVVRRIDADLSAAIAGENARPVADFKFATALAAGDVVQLSPLSSIAPTGAFPGAIGYFEVDPTGQLSTPLLPESERERESLEEPQLIAKQAIARELADVLEANQLVRRTADAAERQSAPAAFAESAGASISSLRPDPAAATDRPTEARLQLSAGAAVAGDAVEAVEAANELEADGLAASGQFAFDRLAEQTQLRRRSAERAEVSAPGLSTPVDDDAPARDLGAEAPAAVRVASFAGEIEPLRISLLDSGHLVLFRNAWRDEQRYIQGLLVDRAALIRQSFAAVLTGAGLAEGTALAISIGGEAAERLAVTAAAAGAITVESRVVSAASERDTGTSDNDTLLTSRLSPPLSDIELRFTAGTLDRGPGFSLLVWTAIALAAVLVGGFLSMYRFGTQQLKLAREQRNFVSAVSHELKTPLTSIRMYGEMLKSGWADEDQRQRYYDFIVDEGERLSRLIENVLVLSRLNNGAAAVTPVPIELRELFDLLRSKLSSQVERAGFTLDFDLPADDIGALAIAVDADALTQVFINLVDNAIKFSGTAATRRIVLAAQRLGNSELLLTVRDFGPGIPPPALKRLFELFYRPDNELTRTTSGTGIGLALVRQLVTAMDGRVDVRNCDPGAEFRLRFRLDRDSGNIQHPSLPG